MDALRVELIDSIEIEQAVMRINNNELFDIICEAK